MTGRDYDPSDPVTMFEDLVPGDFLEAAVRELVVAYERTNEQCAVMSLGEKESRDLRPYLRRALFENSLRELAARERVVTGQAAPNAAGNCSHTVVKCGRVLLTASATEHPNQIVRHAVFRETYARSNQLLFNFADSPPRADAPLYAILIHGPASELPTELGFAQVVFPSPSCRMYIGGRVDLLARFSAVLGGEPSPEETVVDEVSPRLRKPIARKANA